ncbi:MAG TPA: sugar phosphate nucleotidyltransferase [Gemmatimonadales bacterium]|nr:sugar phosphate nucleotidyltransferase [Gemmatimonadales bacterium]
MSLKAVVLARGLGSRMRRADASARLDPEQARAADRGAKGMVPVGRPFLEYALSALAAAGVTDACLVIGPEHQAVREHFARISLTRLRLHFAIQEEPRGTADAVLAAREFAGKDRFLAVNSDNYYPVDALRALGGAPRSAMAAFEREALVRDGNLGAGRVAGFPGVRVTSAGTLAALEESARDAEWVSMNCWAFTPKIFDACRAIAPGPTGELELPAAVRRAVRDGEVFDVFPFALPVLDLTRRADVERVTRALAGVEVRL